ncbi:MAG TPA: tetratricopeptide repeat protein [Thermoanaerobaculia bacterium]|nr:tetratricopeptide repeat protein [Thermoanaerobaculia bacterium]
MRLRAVRLLVLALVCAFAGVAFERDARAEATPPREIWPQATGAADNNDVDTAIKRTNALIDTGKAYGIKTYPLYAGSAAALSRQAQKTGNKEVASWARKAADQLDPQSPAVAFSNADAAADQKQWGAALPAVLTGFARVFGNYRTRLLSRSDMIILIALAIALTAAIFALALFIRYGRSMAHDFREILGGHFRGGSVSVLAFALLFLPIFIWLGPIWLLFYWFVIFFGYANPTERTAIIVLALLVALLPIVLDQTSTWIAGVDSPVVIAAIASTEQSYHPEVLRRMQELVAIVPDNPTLQLLLGDLQLQEGNEQQAAVHYRRSLELHESAGAHVNLGNLHFLENDFGAANTEYAKAETLDPTLAIAFYNHSVASGEQYRFDEQGQKLEQAKKIDRSGIERLSANPPSQKIVIFHPSIAEAWTVASGIAEKGTARSLFGNYAYFDPAQSVLNPVTLGALLAVLVSILVWLRRRKAGFAGSCIKCGRTFCHRCKSARESATYCTQCIHIYLKRDGVSLDTKRTKLDEVHDHHSGMLKRNKAFATFIPGSAQALEGRTIAGIVGMFFFFLFVAIAITVGRLAPAIGPAAQTAHLLIRTVAILLAVITWILMSLPVYRRRLTT